MSNMIPASRGNKVNVGSVPSEAFSKGLLNEGPSREEARAALPSTLDEGPVRGDKEEFKPASYRTKSGSVRSDR